jgi:lipopolysaccharide heptosyltransferase II
MYIIPDSVHRILVIKLRGVGDVLLSTIVLENLRSAFPKQRIDFLTEKPGREVLRGNPVIDELIIFDKAEISSTGLIRKIRRNRYDLIFDLFSNPRTAFITFCSGARWRVGYPFRGRGYAYNVYAPLRGGEVHNTQFNLDALEAAGIPVVSRSLMFPYSDDDNRFAVEYLASNGLTGKFVVGFSTGGGWSAKRWGVEKFAGLGDMFIDRWNAKVILLWGPGQEKEVEDVQQRMENRCSLPPKTTLKQLGALVHQCSMVIGNDSGPMHIAAALHVPTLGIYGPTDPKFQGPYGPEHGVVQKVGLDCLGCNLTECPIGNPCMKNLTIEEVMAAAERIMEKNKLNPVHKS